MLILCSVIAVPYLSTIFGQYKADLNYIVQAGDRATSLQQLAESAEALVYCTRGWLPAAEVTAYQTQIAGRAAGTREVNDIVISLSSNREAWMSTAVVELISFDDISARPTVAAPSAPLTDIRGNPLAMEQAVNGSIEASYTMVRRTASMRLVDATQHLADVAAAVSLLNVSAYGDLTGSARNTKWQQLQQRLLEIAVNSGRTGVAELKAIDSINYGKKFIADSASNVSTVSLAFMTALVTILLIVTVMLYLPMLNRIDRLRNLTVTRFLRIPVRVIQVLHRQSMRRVKQFNKMEAEYGSDSEALSDSDEAVDEVRERS